MSIRKTLYGALAAVCLLGGCGRRAPAPESMPEVPATEIPEDGWTESSIADTIYFDGEKIGFPFSPDELSEDWQLVKMGEEAWEVRYKDKNVGVASITEIDGEDAVTLLSISALKDYERYPVAVNGVSIGSARSDVENNLGFSINEFQSSWDNEKRYQAFGHIGGVSVSVFGNTDSGIVDAIILNYDHETDTHIQEE